MIIYELLGATLIVGLIALGVIKLAQIMDGKQRGKKS